MSRLKKWVAMIAILAAGAALSGLALAPRGRAEDQTCAPATTTTSTSTTTSTTPSTPSPPPVQPPQGHPLNNVTVENCIGGTIQGRSKLQVGHTSGDTADPANFAYAYAHDCTPGCAAISAAFQVVLVPTGTPNQTPENIALAVNYNCNGCAVFAFADQYALNVAPGTRLSGETRQEIARIRREVAQDVANVTSFSTLDNQLKALATEEHNAVDTGLQQAHVPVFHRHSSEHVEEHGRG
jgi:hypothetical protein